MKRVQALTLATLVGIVGCYGGDSTDTAVNPYDVNRKPTVQQPESNEAKQPNEVQSAPTPPAVADPDAERQPMVTPPASPEVVDATPSVLNKPIPADDDPAPSVPPQEQPNAEEVVAEPATEEPATSEPSDDPAATPPADTIADTAPALPKEEIRLRPETPAEPTIDSAETETPGDNNELRNLLNELGVESANDEPAPASKPAPAAPVEVADTTPPAAEPSESETPADERPALDPVAPATNVEEINPPESADPQPAGSEPATPAPADASESDPPETTDQPEPAGSEMPRDKTSQLREWVDSTGRLKIKGSFVRFDKKMVVVRTEGGDELTIPISRLSSKDQAFLKPIKRGDYGI